MRMRLGKSKCNLAGHKACFWRFKIKHLHLLFPSRQSYFFIITVVLLLDIQVPGHDRLVITFCANETEGWLDYLSPPLNFS
jgi:hypothetical protein